MTNNIDNPVREFVTELLTNNPDNLYDIADSFITALGPVVMAGSLNHSETMRSQGDAVLESMSHLFDSIVEEATRTERTERSH